VNIGPELGFRPETFGVTAKLARLLEKPPTVTTAGPVVAPIGNEATMLVALQLVGVADAPLSVTVLFPCVAPKLVPVIVTEVPAGPLLGFRLVIVGVREVTEKLTPLLATPPTTTTTFPVVAPVGTGAVMFVELQLVGVAVVPLNVTVLVPCKAAKLVPAIVIDVPNTPAFGLRFVILGAGRGTTAKKGPSLAMQLTVTTTGPVVAPFGTTTPMLVALQLLAVPAEIPLNVTLLVPCEAPKVVPEMMTRSPTDPVNALRLVMFGDGVIEKFALLLVNPFTATMTSAFARHVKLGTIATMLVSLQLVTVGTPPPIKTELDPCEAPKFVPVIVKEVPRGPEAGFKFVMKGAGV